MNMEESKLVRVFSGSHVDAEIMKQILEENGIAATVRNELMSSIAPYQVSGGAIAPADVEVFEKDREKALMLVEEFYKTAK